MARLLALLETLEAIARRLHPPVVASLAALMHDEDAALRAAQERFATVAWPEALHLFRDHADRASTCALRAADGLRAAASTGDLRAAYRALRQLPRALEALYPLAGALPAVSRFFLEPSRRDDADLLGRLAVGAERTGVMHAGNDTNERGGVSIYVPEDYDPRHACPLVMALHGGAGHGRLFLWSWLREARSRGVIVVAPTATGDTWSLMQPELDGANLAHILDQVAASWPIDRSRVLLTGMSDGGTFTLVSGLDEASPFTHLAPVAASFHPLLLGMASPRRVSGLPVYLVHGALDWMFPVSVGRAAHEALRAAGAAVVYQEIADLSHTYPREQNCPILDWLCGSGG
jgi:phospholipase/carboxylesterase